MGRKVAHKQTKLLLDSSEVKDGIDNYTPNWKGRIMILDSKKSEVANKIGVEKKGEYAIKVR